MSIAVDSDRAAAMREDPFGDTGEIQIGEVMGKKLPPAVIPEDNLRPGAKFVFGQEVADVFEELVIPRQVPGYAQMRLRALHVGRRFIKPGSAMLDIGTSRARMIRDLIASFGIKDGNEPEKIDNVRYIGIDNEPPMLELARVDVNALFAKLGGDQRDSERIVKFKEWDLRTGVPSVNTDYCLITSILTIQFVPIEYRQRIIQSIYDNLAKGGAFVWIEKVLGESADIDDMLQSIYHDDKRRNGISEEAILKKRESIEGFLVPQTSKANIEMLHAAGFRVGKVGTFWRDLNFEAYVAIKD